MQPNTFISSPYLLTLLASAVAALPVSTRAPAAPAAGAAVTGDLPALATLAADPTLQPSKLEDEFITDQYLFNSTLDTFIGHRDMQDPSFLFWESDGCSESPDHPFGFDYLPACYRHDFGYDQYKRQNRFTQGNKEKLDKNFKKDLDNICSAPDLQADICKQCAEDPDRTDVDCQHRAAICKFPAQDVCGCLADLYFRAVTIFGGQGTIQPGLKHKRGGLFDKMIGEKIPKFDLATLGLCLAKSLPSGKDKPVA